MIGNKKGFSLIYGLMLSTILFLLGMALAPSLKEVTGEVMDDTALNRSNQTNQQLKAVCTSIDMQQLFVGIIFGIAGLIIWRLV